MKANQQGLDNSYCVHSKDIDTEDESQQALM